MKYIKVYEIYNKDSIKLIPGYMYKHLTTPVYFIGYNDGNYPLLCLVFHEDLSFIEWIEWMNSEEHLPPLNMTIRDYIIKNQLVRKIMKVLEKPVFSSGGCKSSLSKIKKLKEEFLKDKELMNLLKIEIEEYELKKAAKKYNL